MTHVSAVDAGALQAYLEDFEASVSNGGGEGPSWLLPARRAAIERFTALGFPTTRVEDWHFTSVAPIAEREFRVAEPADVVTAADVQRFSFGHPEWSHLVFVNGRYVPELSLVEELPAGVRVADLAEVLRDDPELIERYLTKVADATQNAFTALNTAFMRHGAVVHIPADAVVESPIHLLFIADGAAGGVAHPRNLIVAGRHSSATVVESYLSLGDAEYFTNAVTEVAVGDGARLNHYKLQRESERAFHIGTTEVHQARDSHYVSFSFATGGALSRTNIYTMLDGEGCGATLNGLYMV
ncbi:MAG TPA: SufD family Fe-S cluster assembly protein, partial [Gemmatimonadaceae bacterium]